MHRKIKLSILPALIIIFFSSAVQGQMSVKWFWNGGTTLPSSNRVVDSPIVINLNDDNFDMKIDIHDIPDVVFTSRISTSSSQGLLRAVNGADGSELFTVTDPTCYVEDLCHIAAGDIDNDGLPEIIAAYQTAEYPIAFEHDGTFKWYGDTTTLSEKATGSLHIADLDRDGIPEIICGPQVWDNTGKLKWVGSLGQGGIRWHFSCCADIDMDGMMEVLAGNTAYRHDGTVLWYTSSVPDGYSAVADFDRDGIPEVVVVTDYSPHSICLLNNDGSVRWGPISIPGYGSFASNPCIEDFNADGYPEILLTVHSTMTLFDRNGAVVWTKSFYDYSGANGPAAFDLDQDGICEILYNDEDDFYVLKGLDGSVLESAPVPSLTGFECPVIADVDNDGSADVVVAGSSSPAGVRVFSNPEWKSARPIWNQFDYRITNVHNLGQIPRFEPDQWLLFNNYRTQTEDKNIYYIPLLNGAKQVLCCLFFFTLFVFISMIMHNPQ